MDYCRKCGSKLDDTAQYCNNCGTPVFQNDVSPDNQKNLDTIISDEVEPQKQGFAISSFICGILSLFTFGLTSLPAIILGHISLKSIKKGEGDGKVFSVIGLSLGYITFLFTLLCFLGLFLTSYMEYTSRQDTVYEDFVSSASFQIDSSQTDTTSAIQPELDSTFIITANHLFEEFDTDPTTAEIRYLNRRIALQGEIQEIGEEVGSDQLYVVVGASGTNNAVWCYFPEDNRSEVMQLNTGEMISLAGTVEGKYATYVKLEECELQEFVEQQDEPSTEQELTGGRSRANIMRVVRQNTSSLQYAYVRRLADEPGLEGKITLKWAVDEYGTVIFCTVISSTMNDEVLEEQIVAKIKRWAFGRINKPGDITEVEYPFIFSEQ